MTPHILESEHQTLPIDSIIFDKTLYPRISVLPELVQQYVQDIDKLPPIEVDQKKRVIDGGHRWMAHKKAEKETIQAVITEVADDSEFMELAIARNASHGRQLSQDDKKMLAIALYAKRRDKDKDDYKQVLAKLLSVSIRSVQRWCSDIDADEKEKRKQTVHKLWMASHNEQAIADKVGISQQQVNKQFSDFTTKRHLSLDNKINFTEDGYKPPVYNVWNDARLTNKVKHFGNSEQAFVDRLLYLYTDPFDIVVDPFAGGGSTIDVCRRRHRRYLVSDRKPIIEREDEIRQHDITDGILKPPQWKDVGLVYLDPPYWRQAQGQYSDDPTDLGNMPLEAFNNTLSSLIQQYGKSLCDSAREKPSYIALIIRPTQWNADNREFVDHIGDMLRMVKLPVDMRYSVPYSTEQYTPQCVNWAKEHKRCLVLTREIVVWRCGNDL